MYQNDSSKHCFNVFAKFVCEKQTLPPPPPMAAVYKMRQFYAGFKKPLIVSALFLFFASHLSAACVNNSGIVSCTDETVNSSVYEAYPANSSYTVNTTVANAYGIHANNSENFKFNNLNISTAAANSYGIYAQNGGNISAGNNININTTGSNSAAIYALQGSKISLGSNVNIYTNASTSQGINVRGTNAANKAFVEIGDNLNILTEGSQTHSTGKSNSDGLNANFADVTIGDNLSILTTGIGSFGLRIDNVSNIKIGDGATVATRGDTGCGSCGTGGSGWFSYGVEVRRGSNLTVGDDFTVDVTGTGRFGTMAIQVLSGDSMPNGYTYLTIGDNLKAITSGNELSVGLWAQGASIVNIGDNAYISTTGGVNKGPTSAVVADTRASSGGTYYYPKITFGDNATILTTGGYSHGLYALQGHIALGDDAKIITTGDQSVGVYSWGSASTSATAVGEATVAIGKNAVISTSGNANLVNSAYGGPIAAHAIIARQGGNVTLGDNAAVSVSGNKAAAVYITNYNANANVRERFASSVVFEGTSTLNANGNNTKILELTYANSSLNFNGATTFNTLGDTIDVFAISNTGNNKYNENVHFNDSLTINSYGSSSKAIYLDDGYTYDFNKLNINVYGDNSYALYAGLGSNLTLDDETSLNAFKDNSYALYSKGGMVTNTNTLNILGNILSDDNANISLSFNDKSSFTGSTFITSGGNLDLSFDNSKWNVLQNSMLNTLKLSNNAIVDLTHSNSALSNPTSIIADSISGNGIFNVRFDANNKINDTIFITDSSSGTHTLNFYDKSAGGYKNDGNLSLTAVQYLNPSIGDYQADFTGHADIGAYTYELSFDNNTQSYYVGDVTPSGVVIPGKGANLNNAAVSSIGFLTINYLSNYINTQNILQRMGELRNTNENINKNSIEGDVWVRTYIGKLGSFDDNTKIESMGYYGFQIGADKLSYLNSAKLYTGLTFGYLKSDTDYTIGDSESTLYDLGVYALYKDDNNFYADTLVKYVKNDNGFNTKTSNNLTIDGSGESKGFSLSVEVGKRYDVKSSVYIEPQAELTYAKQKDFDITSSNNLKTNIKGFDSYLARVGVAFGYRFNTNANIYFKTGYIKELSGKTSYSFNDVGNTQKEYKLNQNIFDNAIGFTLNANNHNLYIEGNFQKGSEFDNLKANVGYRWGF